MHTQDGSSLSLDGQLCLPPYIPALLSFPILLRLCDDVFGVVPVPSISDCLEQSHSPQRMLIDERALLCH